MMKKILLVEDNTYKRERIIEFISGLPHKFLLAEAHSFASGSQSLLEDFPLVVLDVSLPTYDKDTQSSGGRFRPFGGRELARKIIRRNLSSKILFITQYEAFSDKDTSLSVDELTEELKHECGSRFLGLIRYDNTKSNWKEELASTLCEFEDENSDNR